MSDMILKNFVAMEASLNSYVNNVITTLLSEGGVSEICMKNGDYNSVLFDGANGTVQAKSIRCWDSTNNVTAHMWADTDNNSGQLALFKGDGTRSIYVNGQSGGMSLTGNLAVAGDATINGKILAKSYGTMLMGFDGNMGYPCLSNHNVRFEWDGAHLQLYVEDNKIAQIV